MITAEEQIPADAADFAKRTAHIPESFLSELEMKRCGCNCGCVVMTTPESTICSYCEKGTHGTQLPEGVPEVQVAGLTVEAIESTLHQLSKMAAKMVKGGEFWQLEKQEAKSLADVWHPILAPLWAKWLSETNGYLLPALMVTTMSLLPRLGLEAARRASLTASMATESSGDLQPSSVPPAAENPLKPTD